MRQAQRPLSPGWVAGSVRARNMLARRIGADQARVLAGAASLDDALSILAGTAYGRFVRPGLTLGAAQRAVAETALWHVRVLAGWTPPRALEPVRALAGWFELVNIEDRLAYLAGVDVEAPFALGGLGTVWARVTAAQSAAEVRELLASSRWGDPGADDLAAVGLALRFAWARRLIEFVPESAAWAAGALGLLLARELFLNRRSPGYLAARRPPAVGSAWRDASDVRSLAALLPAEAAWALVEVENTGGLWRAEISWIKHVEQEAARLAHDPHLGRSAVIGCVVLLGVDAWRAAGALAAASRGAMGAFEEIG